MKGLLGSNYLSLIVTALMLFLYVAGLCAVFFSETPLMLMAIVFDLPVLAGPGFLLSTKQFYSAEKKIPSAAAMLLNLVWFSCFICFLRR